MTALTRALTVVVLVLSAVFAQAQAYTSIVVIGDSLSDTGNDTKVSATTPTAGVPVPAPITGYTQGSFTDGTDTSPAAVLYNGVWVKQLAAMLPAKPSIVDSLDGGTNYAYGFAFTGSGTTTFAYGPGNVFSFPVNNMGLQLSTYLATKPTINNKTLFVVWGGANDLLNGINPGAAATNEVNLISSLISAGATDILVCGLPPLGAIPRLAGTGSTATQASAAAAGFNQIVSASLANLPTALGVKGLHLYYLDVFTLFNTIIASPSTYGFANVTAMSQGVTGINPDTYLFWDGLHPTTAGHHQVALAAAALIAPGATSTTVASSSLASNLNASVTFTATVTSTSGIPNGTVTFYDGGTAIGTSQLSGTSPDIATFTTSSLTAGTHSITAAYNTSQYFNTSTSTAISEIVTAPAISASLNPTSLTIKTGSTGTATVSVASVGGYAGTVTVACATGLPVHVSCSYSSGSLAFTGTNNTLTTTVTINTSGNSAALRTPTRPGSSADNTILACTLLPFFSFLVLRRKQSYVNLRGLTLLLLLSLAAIAGLSGCAGSSSNNAAAGTYTIPIAVTANGANTTLNLNVTITN